MHKHLKLSLLLSLTLLISVATLGQKQNITLEDAILKRYSTFNPENIRGLMWLNNGKEYVHVKDNNLYKSGVGTSEEIMVDFKDFSGAYKSITGDEITYFPAITWMSESKFRFTHSGAIYSYDVIGKSIVLENDFADDAQNLDVQEKTLNVAYTRGNNLIIQQPNQTEVYITVVGDPSVVFGQTVHRSEFGINKGTFWSPSGNLLAFYRMDETMVTDYPIVDMTQRIATLKNIKYPMAGMKSHEVTVGVYNVAKKKTVFLQTGEPREQYLTNIAWSPDDKYIYMAIVNRDQNHMQLKQFDAVSGKYLSTLFEEKDEKFTEPENPVMHIPNSTNLLFFSNRDGYKQLYSYSKGKIKRMSSGNFDITEFIRFNPSGSLCYFIGATNNGLERQLFSLNLKNGKQQQLTNANGTHNVSVNDEGMIIDKFSSITVPRKISILNTKGKVVSELLTAGNPMEDYNFASTELLTIKNQQGLEFNCRMIKPSNFDPSKKYPVIVYVYGGPHAQLINNDWLGDAPMWMHYQAERGYIIFTLDNRGSHNRGVEFSRATFRKLGDVEMEDQMTGVEYLKTLPFIDQNKMAVHGWSFGGFMTTSLMLRKPGTFKVGVAGGPVIDWSLYEIMYGERYMDTPEQNPEGYGKSDVSQYVENLDGDLLIIHGQVDPVVVPQHSMKLLKASVDKQVQIDFFTYPGHEHNVRGKDRVHLMQKVLDYIEDKLN